MSPLFFASLSDSLGNFFLGLIISSYNSYPLNIGTSVGFTLIYFGTAIYFLSLPLIRVVRRTQEYFKIRSRYDSLRRLGTGGGGTADGLGIDPGRRHAENTDFIPDNVSLRTTSVDGDYGCGNDDVNRKSSRNGAHGAAANEYLDLSRYFK
jgi:hypothetical protein